MPELPDIAVLARSMNQALSNRTIVDSVVNQPKCLNRSKKSFRQTVRGRIFNRCYQRGKWVLASLDQKWTLAFNLGMGGEIRLHSPVELHNPKRERVVFLLDTAEQIWVYHWWFGYVHILQSDNPKNHFQLGDMGPEPLAEDFTVEKLTSLLEGRRGRIKSYLLDQRFIAGIGNVYVQDILWHARLHPNRKAITLDATDIKRLHWAIQHVLKEGIRFGGAFGEMDIWGNKGTYHEHRPVGYRTGNPCPACKTSIEEIRVGSTTSYICPKCQK